MLVWHQNIEHFYSNSTDNHNSSWQAKKNQKFLPKISQVSQILHLRGNSPQYYRYTCVFKMLLSGFVSFVFLYVLDSINYNADMPAC